MSFPFIPPTVDDVSSSMAASATHPELDHPGAALSPLPLQLPRPTRVPLSLVGKDCGKLVLQLIMRETGLSLRQLAERLGIKVAALQTYMYKDRNPSVMWLCRVLSAAGGRVVVELPRL